MKENDDHEEQNQAESYEPRDATPLLELLLPLAQARAFVNRRRSLDSGFVT
jgi:hypothetical protein